MHVGRAHIAAVRTENNKKRLATLPTLFNLESVNLSRKTAPYSLNTNIESLGDAAHGCSSGLVSVTNGGFNLRS
jgi:hypothetical protein